MVFRSRDRKTPAPLRVMPWLPAVVLVIAVVGVGGAAALWLLGAWDQAQSTSVPAEQLRLERIKTALAVAAGLGAGLTLLIALRKQSVSERAQRFLEEDAQQQRVTSLYLAAVEQIGSEKAAVRLGGLHALDRLGSDTPQLRQTVVEVMCAYLRMPYQPPQEVYPSDEVVSADQEAYRRQELQVRLTAQRLLAEHLRPARDGADGESESFWRKENGRYLDLDFSGATLVQPNLARCAVGRIQLAAARIHGYADLRWVRIHGRADLENVVFYGLADLNQGRFFAGVDLSGATFHGNAALDKVHFAKEVDLTRAIFHGNAYLGRARFDGRMSLSLARFEGAAQLGGIQCFGYANLSRTLFARLELAGARFTANASLHKAIVAGAANLDGAVFGGYADFNGARFSEPVRLASATFTGNAYLAGALVAAGSSVPGGWRVGDGPVDGELSRVFRGGVSRPADVGEPTGGPL